jgi:hypothetical protein
MENDKLGTLTNWPNILIGKRTKWHYYMKCQMKMPNGQIYEMESNN